MRSHVLVPRSRNSPHISSTLAAPGFVAPPRRASLARLVVALRQGTTNGSLKYAPNLSTWTLVALILTITVVGSGDSIASPDTGARPSPPPDSLALPGAIAPADTLLVPLQVEAPAETLDLGSPFDVHLSLTVPGIEGLGLGMPPEQLKPFELAGWRRELDRGDTAEVVLTLRAFRVGPIKLPPLVLAGWTTDRAVWVATSDSVELVVASIVHADSTEIHDIHESIMIPGRPKWWILAALVLLVLAAWVAYFLIKRRGGFALEPAPAARPAAEVALEAIRRLELSGQAQRGPWRPFYTELTYVLRSYIARRFGLDAPEQTTSETLRAAATVDLPTSAHAALRSVLMAGDGVKFARQEPLSGSAEQHIHDARRFVEQTRPMPVESEMGGGA